MRLLLASLLGGPRPGRTAPPGPAETPASASSLSALTAAALALPGLAGVPAHAVADDEFSFQWGRYEEGQRQLFENNSKTRPIRVDSLHAAFNTTLFDRFTFLANYQQDTWSGATPVTTAPRAVMSVREDAVSGASAYVNSGGGKVDRQLRPSRIVDGRLVPDPRPVHMVTTASPETRKQGDFALGYEWSEAALDLSGGLSQENDYDSRFVGLGGRLDLNRKLTTLALNLNYNQSDIAANQRPGINAYLKTAGYEDRIEEQENPDGTTTTILHGRREDWSVQGGITQILDKDSLLETSLTYTRSTGFLENPYKGVTFIMVDPEQTPGPLGELSAQVPTLLENRPDLRNQWTVKLGYQRYVPPLDAALHLDYRFFSDDWGIDAHTFEARWAQPLGLGWTITPRVRYYTQGPAFFYRPYVVLNQELPITGLDPAALPLKHWSSDHRLSGFGALSGGVTLAKQLGRAVNLEAGVEYYTHQGDLRLGGGGEGDYADFDAWLINAALRVDLSAPATPGEDGHPAGHHHHAGHGRHGPAGVMFDHTLHRAGEAMVGYRYMYSAQSGGLRRGDSRIGDAAVVAQGCETVGCSFAPDGHGMHMHMLDLMYAPADWLTLMVMPQFMDMDMNLRPLPGGPAPDPDSGGGHHAGGGHLYHATGGVGDTGLYALFELWRPPGHNLHLSLGITAPTGDVDLRVSGLRKGQYIHYGMQLGSGTWDFRPSLTYTGDSGAWFWGGQLSGVKRLEDRNEVGYVLGDGFQGTVWGGYDLTAWLSASLRGVYTAQGANRGRYREGTAQRGDAAPMDFPANYGGQFWDLGLGLNAKIPLQGFEGQELRVEWLQPIKDDFNGIQEERDGSLYATWTLKF
jgi:hypothetical protein